MESLSIRKSAGDRLDAKAKAYAQSHNVAYREALYLLMKQDPELGRSYAHGEQTRRYDASPARKVMDELLSDRAKTQRLAGAALDRLAKAKVVNIGPGVADPIAEYRRALVSCNAQYPGLAAAAESGFIRDDDFATLGLIVPSVLKEIEEGRYETLDAITKRYY